MSVIIQKFSDDFQSTWQKEFTSSFTTAKALMEYLDLPFHADQTNAAQLFSVRVPLSFAKRMKKGDIKDPLLLQVMPQGIELETKNEYSKDPLNEQSSETPGLLHKYKSRVLLILRTSCAVNCRYCFRRHFPYQDNQINHDNRQQILEYIRSNPEINEVILSGGDPLMAKDSQIGKLIAELETIDTVKTLRIHSRLPVVIPKRITNDLTKMLSTTALRIVFVFHINHANEINNEFSDAIQKLKQPNITLLNQAVLLHQVNDSVASLTSLSKRLFEVGILPYYLFLLDKVEGAAHFDMSENSAVKLFNALQKELPGYLVPKLAREIGGRSSKTLINTE